MTIRKSIRRLVRSIKEADSEADQSASVLRLLVEREYVIDMTGGNTKLLSMIAGSRIAHRRLSDDELEWIVTRLLQHFGEESGGARDILYVLCASRDQRVVPFLVDAFYAAYSDQDRVRELHWILDGLCVRWGAAGELSNDVLRAIRQGAKHSDPNVRHAATSWLRKAYRKGRSE